MANRECQNPQCGRPTDLYLCADCQADLSDLLAELVTGPTNTDGNGRTRNTPGLLQDLEDAATGQARFTTNTPRLKTDHAPLRFNTRARNLITQFRTELTTWTMKLAIHTHIAYTPLDRYDTTGHAMWLAENAHQLAHIDGIGQLHQRLTNLIYAARRCIDRPRSPRFCGQCDTKTSQTGQTICGLALYAHRDDIETTCPQCKTLHNIEKLYNRTLNAADYKTFPREILIGNQRTNSAERYTTGIMGQLDEFVHWRTFHDWTKQQYLKPATYLRPNGRRVFTRHTEADIPEYRLADVRKTRRLMNCKTGKVKVN